MSKRETDSVVMDKQGKHSKLKTSGRCEMTLWQVSSGFLINESLMGEWKWAERILIIFVQSSRGQLPAALMCIFLPRRSSSRMLTSFIFCSQQLGSDLWPLLWLFLFLMLIEPDFHKTDLGNFHGSRTVANQLVNQLDRVRLRRCPWLL